MRKDWQSLLWPRLNVAWLPLDKVFIRALQLPSSDPAEVASMVELQLEKLSPLPVTHLVWSYYMMPRPENAPAETLQNVIVVFALRTYVEELVADCSRRDSSRTASSRRDWTSFWRRKWRRMVFGSIQADRASRR